MPSGHKSQPEYDPLDEALKPPPDETEEDRVIRLAQEAEARRISHQIDESIKAERQQQKKKSIVRLLLLGQSESGMSLPSPPHVPPALTVYPRKIHHPETSVTFRPSSPFLPFSPQTFRGCTPQLPSVKSAYSGAASYNSTSSVPSAQLWTLSQTCAFPPSTAEARTATTTPSTFPTKSTCSECASLHSDTSKPSSSQSWSLQAKTTSRPLSEAPALAHTRQAAAQAQNGHGGHKKYSFGQVLLGKVPSQKALAETAAQFRWEIPA